MNKRLVGEDGRLYKKKFGNELIGDGISDLDTFTGGGAGSGKGWYRITAKAGISGFNLSLLVNDEFFNDGSLIPQIGDKCKFVTEVDLMGITDFSFSTNKAEFEVTTQSDNAKVYRSGKKAEISGSLSAVREIDDTLNQDDIINKFYRIITHDNAGNVTIKEIDNENLFLRGYTYQTDVPGEFEEFIDLEVILTSLSWKKPLDGKQEISCNFRPAGNSKPCIQRKEVV